MSNTQAVGVAYSDPEFTTCYASQEIGYATAAQGVVTQLTNKSTAVTLNKSAGRITMNAASLVAGNIALFTLNNSTISVKDTVIVNVSGGGTAGAYVAFVASMAAGSVAIALQNLSSNDLAQAVIINFCVIHQE